MQMYTLYMHKVANFNFSALLIIIINNIPYTYFGIFTVEDSVKIPLYYLRTTVLIHVPVLNKYTYIVTNVLTMEFVR